MKSDRRKTSGGKREEVVGVLALAARQLRQMRPISDVLNVWTRLNKGEGDGMINCVKAMKTKV